MDELKIEAKNENLSQVINFVDGLIEGMDCNVKTQSQIELAVEELFVNIANYAYTPKTGDATIRVFADKDKRVVSITFIDSGMPYDPLAKEDPDITLSAEERQIGGLGIFMVKKCMDEIEYEHEGGQNILTIRKHC